MSDARQGRGAGNHGKAYRESSFWDSIEKKKKQQHMTKEEFDKLYVGEFKREEDKDGK